ncbi:FtsX-like permease family protein [Melaminivora jejuensis]|uniref:FtsX-like permease family protein n=1 Tax=Melaminivora jejuensis TaxID=1267217 RepID=UPI001E325BC3|nr:ABC transporter permease [Melaminivora jejuensis]UHJ65890.1 FtsX-like permease family protein [Melaminivora jejuensis]
MIALFRLLAWQELRRHAGRSLVAAAAVMLGVALAFAVHLINASALQEFTRATRAAGGQPDVQLRARQGGLPEESYALVAAAPQVARAAPVLEVTTSASRDTEASDAAGDSAPNAMQAVDAASVRLRVVGADALALASMAPGLMPRLAPGADRLALFAPATLFLNAAAAQALGLPLGAAAEQQLLQLQVGVQRVPVRVAGSVAAGGGPLAVMDIGAAQDLFGRGGELSRIDVLLRPGASRAELERHLAALPGWPGGILVAEPADSAAQVDQLSRAYRVNLTVLALVALFTGAFLVYSVLALAVARRAPQLALLAVLGATPRQRLLLVLSQAAGLGVAGSAAGIALGAALAALALRVLGGDLGGGYFTGVQPALQWSTAAALLYGALGLIAALAGGWWPALAARRIAPAPTLKSVGLMQSRPARAGLGAALVLASGGLALLPPLWGIPLAAYVSVGVLLVGGIALLPWLVQGVLALAMPLARRGPLWLLVLARAQRMRASAAVAVGGVVAALSLAVALTVMVGSFRTSVDQWLSAVLPAPLYLRAAGSPAGDDAAVFTPDFVQAAAQLPEVERVQPQRVSSVQPDPALPAVALLARPLSPQPAQALPLVGAALPVPDGQIGVYVSEAIVDLYGVRPGQVWPALSEGFGPLDVVGQARAATFFIAGVWRDYVRQHGAIAMDSGDYQRLTGDARASDLALWPAPDADEAAVRAAVLALARSELGAQAGTLEFTSSGQIRQRSLELFDRSFAVTYWLQAVAIGIGLFGVAASFGAQVLARRKEFGLLAHLGLTRAQILAVVAGEGAAWTAVGALAGTLLGLAVAVVLVHVVNPQSFHWTMELRVPVGRLAALAAAVMAAGTVTAWVAGRAAVGRDAVLAVREDW